MKRRIAEILPDLGDNEHILDLKAIKDQQMTVAELQELAFLHKRYTTYKTLSGLCDEGWADALGISTAREKAYTRMSTKVPNLIMNRAHKVQSRIRRLIRALKKGYQDE